MARKPLPWSHSALSDFLNCAKQYFHKRIAKDVVDEQGEAALWGDQVHKFFEASILQFNGMKPQADEIWATLKLQGMDPDESFKTYLPYLEAVLAIPCDAIYPERQYALDKALKPCDWFAKEVWCRGIIDVLIVKGDRAYALDWKTGKRKPDSKQLMLFALLVFIHHPEIQSVKTEFVWLKTGERDGATYTREQEAEMWQAYLPDLARYNAAFKQDMWIPRKSGLCRGWCPVTSCEFWEPKRLK
jgi:hypothetical protein